MSSLLGAFDCLSMVKIYNISFFVFFFSLIYISFLFINIFRVNQNKVRNTKLMSGFPRKAAWNTEIILVRNAGAAGGWIITQSHLTTLQDIALLSHVGLLLFKTF